MRNSLFTCDTEGRVICMDTALGDTKVRLINVYTPANNKHLNIFFSNLEPFLLNRPHTIIGGDFNCVLDSLRDARYPSSHPRPMWCTRALQLLVTQHGLIDAWTEKHGIAYVPTWKQGASCSRLDRFYLPSTLLSSLHDCEVLNPSLTGISVSDHQAAVITINVPHQSNLSTRNWRLSTALLIDPEIVKSIKLYLEDTLPTTDPAIAAWEQVKEQLRLIFT